MGGDSHAFFLHLGKGRQNPPICTSSEGIRWLSRVMVRTVSTIWAVSSGKLHLDAAFPHSLTDDVSRMGFSLVMMMRENFWCMKALSRCSFEGAHLLPGVSVPWRSPGRRVYDFQFLKCIQVGGRRPAPCLRPGHGSSFSQSLRL